MSKFNIGVGEAFPLEDDKVRERSFGCRHHPHRQDQEFDHRHHHPAAVAMMFAMKAYRRRMRKFTEPNKDQ
jgi:hypothetical protein